MGQLEVVTELIKNKIKSIDNSGNKYYNYKPNSGCNEVNTYDGKDIHTFKNKSEVFVYTNYFKILVDQKIDYLLAKNPSNEELPEEFDIITILDEGSLIASLNTVAWLHLYLNDEGNLDWIWINDDEVIPVYDKYNKYITDIIRFYKKGKIMKVELWDKKGVTFFDLSADKFVLNQKSITSRPHYEEIIKYPNSDEAETVDNKSFGFIPFIPLWNNKNKTTDLENIKQLIDYYNQISSGFIDNIFRFQEFILLLKGLGGQDLDILIQELKKHKAMNVPEGAGADYLKIDIPVEARSVILEILKKNIFLLGRGVDLQTLSGAGSNITNILIKAMYADLDMKANDTEKQYRLFYRQLIKYISTYYKTPIDNTIKFNRSMLFNEAEAIKSCQESLGIISMRTIRANHPWVSDIEIEEAQVAKENDAYNLDSNDGDSNG